MTQEEKQLLIKDLCARLPYGVKALETYYEEVVELICIYPRTHNIEAEILSRIGKDNSLTIQNIQFFKPYLRPMSSMTEEEKANLEAYSKQELDKYADNVLNSADKDTIRYSQASLIYKDIDWYNTHHFDYRGLIRKGLALEAPEGMYNTKNE